MKTRLLTIAIVTMNRKDELLNAIISCYESMSMPLNSEFFILDNGSTDSSQEYVEQFFNYNTKHVLKYVYLKKNVGIAEGRNICLREATGKYIYNIDDDSIIPKEMRDIFFEKCITILENNQKYATLTTRVYDKCLKMWRESKRAKSFSKINPMIYAVHGNSYFIRSELENMECISTIKYGYEDVCTSLLAIDNGYINALCEEVYTYHCPKINKWGKNTESYNSIIIKANAGLMTIKYLMYPRIFIPIIYLGFFLRWLKLGRNIKGALVESYKLFKTQTINIRYRKIGYKTILKLLYEFGPSVIV